MASSSQFPGPTDTARQFATTHWSVVLTAGAGSSPDAQAALETLCRTYWYPLYAYVRRQGHSPEDAQDLTQAFFERLLEKKSLHEVDQRKGKFRSFLLASLNHFLADQWDHAHRQKRGGGLTFISLDEQKPEERYRLEPPDDLDAQKNFERRWALTLLEQVLARLEAEHTAADKTGRFQALQVFRLGEKSSVTYAVVAARLGTSEGAVKVAVHRLRRRYGELFRAEIANTVASSEDVDEEIRHLRAVLSS